MSPADRAPSLARLPEGAFRLAPEDRDLPSFLRAFAFATAPWFSVLAVVFTERISTGPVLRFQEFQAVLVYVFVAAMLLVGSTQLVLSRYLADALYREAPGQGRSVSRRLAGTLALIGVAAASAYARHAGLPARLLLPGALLLAATVALWVTNVSLYGVKRYGTVVATSIAGALLAILLRGLPDPTGLPGGTWPLLALGAGQLLALALAQRALGRALPGAGAPVGDFLRCARDYPALAVAGSAQAVGLTALSLVAWSLAGVEEVTGFVMRWELDVPVFVAYLVILPGQASFVQELERDFQHAYRRFLVRVEVGSAAEVEASREEVLASFDDAVVFPLRLQAVVSLAAILHGPEVLARLGAVGLDPGLVASLILAATLHGLVLQLSVLAQYLDRRGTLAGFLGLLAVLHVAGTALVIGGSPEPSWRWVVPYAAACLLAAGIGWRRLRVAAERLDYHVLFEGTMRDADGSRLAYEAGPEGPEALHHAWE